MHCQCHGYPGSRGQGVQNFALAKGPPYMGMGKLCTGKKAHVAQVTGPLKTSKLQDGFG